MVKQSKKRTVASFLSDRLKQQVNESYDYLEENTRRVQPPSADEEVSSPPDEQDTEEVNVHRTFQGASTRLADGAISEGPKSLDVSSLTELAKAAEEGLAQAGAVLPEEVIASSKVRSDSIAMTLEPVEPEPALELDEKTAEIEEKNEQTLSEYLADSRSEIQTAEIQAMQASDNSGDEKSLSSQTSKTPFGKDVEIEAIKAQIEIQGVASAESSISIPAKISDLLMSGKIPLRGVQIYFAMLKDAGYKIGGVATLSYNEISALTSIQTPHIPAILKSLVEMKLVERFRAEKTATSKNSYIIL